MRDKFVDMQYYYVNMVHVHMLTKTKLFINYKIKIEYRQHVTSMYDV